MGARQLCSVLLFFAVVGSALADSDQRASMLKQLQQASDDGVIQFTTSHFQELAVGKSRPYSIVFMLTAVHLMDNPQLQLKKVRSEFGFASKAYKAKYKEGSRAGKLFFAELEFKENQHVFQRMGIETLPYIFVLTPYTPIKKTGEIKIPSDDEMTTATHSMYPWSAETIATFTKTRTGLAVEEIPRVSALANNLLTASVLVLLGFTTMVGYRLFYSPIVQNKYIWILGTLGVCWFATSGGLFNIIRGVPYVIPQQDGKVQLFYPGSGHQLGAEGFLVGTGYMLFSSMILVMTYLVPKLESKNARRWVFYVALVMGVWVFRQIFGAYTMKTRYQARHYLY